MIRRRSSEGLRLFCCRPTLATFTSALFLGVVAFGLSFPGFCADLANKAVKATKPTNHWSFLPVVSPVIPLPVKGEARWIRTAVDNFVLRELTKRKIEHSPEADRITLARRLYFDLIGLPPEPQEVDAFLRDSRPDAYEQLVEKLLASPHYGERWGRHWLDTAGYADSNGYFDADSDRPLAYKYRDYVVRCLNADKPFDQFVREQIAGDELAGFLPNGDVTPANEELLTATHFLRNAPDGTGESDGNPQELRVDRYSVLEGNVHLLGSVFMGMTVQCARCHDHKFEPIAQREYYQLQAILRPAYDPDHWIKPKERILTVGTRTEREKVQAEIDRSDAEIKAAKEAIDGLVKPFRKLIIADNLQSLPEAERKKILNALDAKEKDRNKEMKELLKKHEALVEVKDETLGKRFPEVAAALSGLQKGLAKREQQRPVPLPQISVLVEPADPPTPHFILVRGNYAKPGSEVQAGVPAILTPADNPFVFPQGGTNSSGRRLALANWLTSPKNPVVARLMVNRVWQRHFGTGIVPTADNFGVTGAKPSHPELLDFLALEFVRNGWKLKPLHRLMVNSATYRQSSAYQKTAHEADGDNKWLWRFPMQRLDAESIRDAMLATTGELNLSIGGPFVPKDKTEEGQYVIVESQPGARRRTLYIQQRRTTPVTFVDVFDGAKMNPNCVQRASSTVALQSLALLNSDFARTRSKAFGARLMREGHTPKERMNLAFQLALGRPPTETERTVAGQFVAAPTTGSPGADDPSLWTDFCQTIFASNAFLFVE